MTITEVSAEEIAAKSGMGGLIDNSELFSAEDTTFSKGPNGIVTISPNRAGEVDLLLTPNGRFPDAGWMKTHADSGLARIFQEVESK